MVERAGFGAPNHFRAGFFGQPGETRLSKKNRLRRTGSPRVSVPQLYRQYFQLHPSRPRLFIMDAAYATREELLLQHFSAVEEVEGADSKLIGGHKVGFDYPDLPYG